MVRLAAMLVFACVLGCGSGFAAEPRAVPQASATALVSKPKKPDAMPVYTKFRDITSEEKAIIAAAVAGDMKDPESARFRWGRMPEGEIFGVSYCALVNAKNSFGGYVGFKPYQAFVVFRDGKASTAVMIGVGGSDLDTRVIENVCRRQGLDPYSAI